MSREEYRDKGYTEAEVEVIMKLERVISDICEIKNNYVRMSEFHFLRNVINITAGISGIGLIVSVVAVVIAVMSILN